MTSPSSRRYAANLRPPLFVIEAVPPGLREWAEAEGFESTRIGVLRLQPAEAKPRRFVVDVPAWMDPKSAWEDCVIAVERGVEA